MVITDLRSAGSRIAGQQQVIAGRHQWRAGPTPVWPSDDDHAAAAASAMSVPPMKLAGT
jgi:hypothetical protein